MKDIKTDSLWLMKGDCLERMKEIESGSVDLILTDPPYGTTACKWDSVIPLEPMWEQLKRIIKPNGAIVLFGSQPFTSVLVCSNLKMFKYDWVWEKNKATGHLNAKKRPLSAKEDVLVFYSSPTTYNPQMGSGKPYSNSHKPNDSGDCYGNVGYSSVKDCSTRYPRSVIKVKVDIKAAYHPTQKPVPLMEYLIKTYTNENETVLDFTMGSGTTGVACVNTNRKFIGIEMDDNYFDIGSKRITGGVV